MARLTKKRAKALVKATRALGRRPSAKLRRAAGLKTNPGTKAGARKARRKKARKVMRRRRAERKRYTKKRSLRGYKITARRKAGRRKANKSWGRKKRVRTGRKGTISFRKPRGRGRFKLVATNPRRRKGRKSRRMSRRRRSNPPLTAKSWSAGLTELPSNLGAIFKGKDMLPNIGFVTAGALGGIVVGGVARGYVMGAVGKVAPGLASNRLVQGVLGAAITYTGGYAVGQMLIKNQRRRIAFITGSAIAAIANAIMPGQINRMLISIPVIGPQLAQLPGMNGIGYHPDALAEYVLANGYQGQAGLGKYVKASGYQGQAGLGKYVSADSYQAVGYDPAVAGDALAGELNAYVEADSYQATNGLGDVGMYGASHLDY